MYGFNDFISTLNVIPKTQASPFIQKSIEVQMIQNPNFSNDPLSDVTYRLPPVEAITIAPKPINTTITNQEFTTSNFFNSTMNSSNVSNFNNSLNDMFKTQMKISEKNLNVIETQNKNILDLSEKNLKRSKAFVGPMRESSNGGILLLLPLLFLIK